MNSRRTQTQIIRFIEGETMPIRLTIYDTRGVPIDLDNATVEIKASLSLDLSTADLEAIATPDADQDANIGQAVWEPDGAEVAGEYYLQVHVTDSSGMVQKYPRHKELLQLVIEPTI